mmetsp:Transcript_14973/g.44879  ORF Transcript_14973/g.44879 Transcript_14973/m.44879 type:complete len:446 (+) Transcript_14973:85-1422(+)
MLQALVGIARHRPGGCRSCLAAARPLATACSRLPSAPAPAVPSAPSRAPQAESRRHVSQVTVSENRLEAFLRAELSYFSQRQAETLKLGYIVNANTPGKVAKLVHKELPFRFAARIKHIEAFEGWEQIPELVALRETFMTSFRELRLAEQKNWEDPETNDLAEFTQLIHSIRKRHKNIVAQLAEVMRKTHDGDDGRWGQDGALQLWVDTFLLSRISTEMLTSHYVEVMQDQTSPGARVHDGGPRVGVVDKRCNPGQICEEAAAQVREQLANSGVSINVRIHNCSSSQEAIEFSYIPRYLRYIVEELLKNSTRATLEALEADAEPRKRPIVVTVCADVKQVAIRISDQGGGQPFGSGEKIWSYQFSTSKQQYEDYAGGESPLSGWGMGLPLARLYARYLGGTLGVMNMPGIGVDAYLFLSRIAPTGQVFEGDLRSSTSSIDSMHMP